MLKTPSRLYRIKKGNSHKTILDNITPWGRSEKMEAHSYCGLKCTLIQLQTCFFTAKMMKKLWSVHIQSFIK